MSMEVYVVSSSEIDRDTDVRTRILPHTEGIPKDASLKTSLWLCGNGSKTGTAEYKL